MAATVATYRWIDGVVDGKGSGGGEMWQLVAQDWLGAGLIIFTIAFLPTGMMALHPWPWRGPFFSIFRLQFAWREESSKDLIRAWEKDIRLPRARIGLWWDFLFLVVYSTLGGLVCRWAATWPGVSESASLATWVARAPWFFTAAAVFDAIEDAASLVLLYGGSVVKPPSIFREAEERMIQLLLNLCAFIKFVFIGAGIVVIVLCFARFVG